MKLSAHFDIAEMIVSPEAARRGIDNTPSMAVIAELQKTAGLLERVRARLERPILITSGYRAPALNAVLPGASPTSAHMWGGAADFICPGYGSPADICRELQHYREALDFDQLILELGWVHIGRARPGTTPRRQLRVIDREGDREVERFA